MKTIILFILLVSASFAQSPLLTLFDSAVAPDSLGADILLGHGTFTTAADTLWWSKDEATGKVFMTGGVCRFIGVPDGAGIYKSALLEVGKTYRVQLTVSDVISGGVAYFLLGTNDLCAVALQDEQQYVIWGECTGNTTLIIAGFTNTTLTIDDIKIEEVLP